MQDFTRLFYPPSPFEDDQNSQIMLRKIGFLIVVLLRDYLTFKNKTQTESLNLTESMITYFRASNLSKDLSSSSVLQQEGLTRGRTLGTNQSQNQRKKNILVIKKESINRQNSFSKSPKNQVLSDNAIDNSFGSPYQSPKINDQPQFNYNLLNTDVSSSNKQPLRELSQSESGIINTTSSQMKNSVIIRKTIGELKRAQLNVFYFDSNLTKSAAGTVNNGMYSVDKNGKVSSTSLSGNKQDQKQNNCNTFQHVKKFEINGRNAITSNYQQFIQRTDVQMSKTFDKHSGPRKSLPNYETDNILLQKFDQNVNQREILRERLEQSSESEDFERQSSNAISVENFNLKGGPKKIVIQKGRVNFHNNQELDNHQISINSQQEQASNGSQNNQIKKVRKSMLAINEQRTAEMEKLIDIQLQIATFSQSPDGLRRQKSDNLLGLSNFKNNSLNHERSQNHLSLHTSNKLEVPKVLKAMPNAAFEELLRSPSSLYTSTIRDSINKKSEVSSSKPSQREIQIATNKLAKSRQSNIFQMRRSQTFLKERSQAQQIQQQKHDDYGQLLQTDKLQRNSPSKKLNNINIVKSSNEVSRVSQSLLLDNFYSKSRERSTQDNRNHDSLSKRNEISTRSSELMNSASTSLKTSPDVNVHRQNAIITLSNNEQMTVPQFLAYGRKSTLSQSLNRLIDENRCNSPVRVQQYMIDVEQMKAIAEKRINKANSVTARGEDLNLDKGPIEVYSANDQKKESYLNLNSNKMHQNSACSNNSNNAIMSLSSVNTKEKFKEIIDNLYVPTASVFKKKTKEKEFRRPTQNPVKRSKSQHRSQQSTKSQKNKEFEDKIKDIYPLNQMTKTTITRTQI
ncbi:UNKNOWN [Stylonychia lemnae]|uniref:Uncharacterized protein n=1 Tax=Stylonychia lemnae TaxID=5949 RepID=A0A078AJN7_STYLE|nr:UNKNOWN [Stylonychia lemnae]|eukprot:CDW81023.1 UNKNOWN [Stylonychia lemnae]